MKKKMMIDLAVKSDLYYGTYQLRLQRQPHAVINTNEICFAIFRFFCNLNFAIYV